MTIEHIDPTKYGYSTAVVAEGRLAFVSGQIAEGPDGAFLGAGDFEAQVDQVFANVRGVVARLGATPGDIVKVTYFVVGLTPERTGIVRQQRAALFAGAAPAAATLLGVEALYAPEALFEVELVVRVP